MMIRAVKTKTMMMKNTITKTKMTRVRMNPNKKKESTQTRSMTSPQMQDRMPIQPYIMRKNNKRNNWKDLTTSKKIQL